MESPVRICLGAALVVSILLLSGIIVSSNALPLETTSTTAKDDRTPRHRINATTWTHRNKQRTVDISLNELNAKDSISEENTEKNSKLNKFRGRVRYQPQVRSTTESSFRRVRSTEVPTVIIVTPTPEVKRPAEIIDSMKTYKKTKMPVLTSSTTPVSASKEAQSAEEEYEDEEEEEDKESFEKYTSNKFHDNNFFTIPSFGDDGFSYDADSDNTEKKEKLSYSSPSYSSFPNFFPEDTSFGYKNEHDSYKSESYFNFDSELTTPKNDFFDKKYTEISKSIITKLDSIKAKLPPINSTKIISQEKLGLDKLPTNKSSVFIKNTKEIRMTDNEEAGTDTKKGLSDVQGTSIYYEMSVLSTETYAINSDDDCDNETLMFEPTVSTSAEEELASLRATKFTIPEATKPTFPAFTEFSMPKSKKSHQEYINLFEPGTTKAVIPESSKQTLLESTRNTFPRSTKSTLAKLTKPTQPTSTKTTFTKSQNHGQVSSTKITIPITSIEPSSSETYLEPLSTISSDYFPISSVLPFSNSVSPIPISTQNIMTSTERISRIFSSSFSRNRNYSKRLNLSGNDDSPNSVTTKPDVVSTARPTTRKFHHTTPKNRPVWMAPRRNVTFIRSTSPKTIYSEHFDIKDKYITTIRNRTPSKSTLTTVSSEIDPVLQSEVSGTKKIVHSPSISDNSIPTLWKRGSSKFKTSTATSTEVESEFTEMEIPPTSVAWALASLKIPPVLSSSVNVTGSKQKPVDENELQKVGELIDRKETTTGSTPTTASNLISNDIITKKVTEVDQNRLPWQPVYAPTSPSSDVISQRAPTESISESLPAGSNILIQSSIEPSTTETFKSSIRRTVVPKPTSVVMKEITPLWVPASVTTTTEQIDETDTDTIQPVDATKLTGFESITKLPSDVTTPSDETAAGSEVNQTVTDERPEATTDYTITTIRFSYVPTELNTDTTVDDNEPTTPSAWHPVFPTRTKATSIKDERITTYRPMYQTTTEPDEYTTISVETTPILEISSQMIDNATESQSETTEIIVNITTTEVPITTTQETTTNSPTTSTSTTTSTTTSTKTSTTTSTTTQPTTTELTTTLPTTTVPPITEIETSTIIVEVITEINSERTKISSETPVETTKTTELDFTSEENSDSNEVITQNNIKTTTTTTEPPTTTVELTTQPVITTEAKPTVEENAKIFETTTFETTESTTYVGLKSISDLEDVNSYAGDVTTSSSQIVIGEEEGSGAAVAIAVSTIGVIALVLLIGLLLVVRRRGRRGIYAQRCTPVSLDAYSLDSVSVGHRKGNHRLRASKRSFGNPAYDDEVTSHPMQYAALANFALDIDSMTAEFSEIPSVTVRPDEVPPGCEDKNRYSNVLPLPETRVPLNRIGNDPTTEYINANFITGPGNIRNYYIACQAPLANTVVDFWRMIWEQNSRLVVMLTEYMENGVEKCYEYLPPSEISDNKRIFGDFKIILKKREQRDKYAVSSVQLINLTTRTWREVTHLWYFWPAKGVPDDYDSVIDFLAEMRSYMKIAQTAKEYDDEGVEIIYGDQSQSSFSNLAKLREDSESGNGVNMYSPAKAEEQMRRANNGTLGRMKAASEIEGIRACVVTCASGAGRSAALVALDVCARALAAGAADVPRVVRELRRQRPHSLANRHHYIFLYKVLSEYGNKMMGGGVDTI